VQEASIKAWHELGQLHGYAGSLRSKVEDVEGFVQWAVDVTSSACYQATIINNPTRLLIEIQNT